MYLGENGLFLLVGQEFTKNQIETTRSRKAEKMYNVPVRKFSEWSRLWGWCQVALQVCPAQMDVLLWRPDNDKVKCLENCCVGFGV